MKVAIASEDGIGISHHFGRSQCFLVFDVMEGKIIGKEVRTNAHTAFAKGECNHSGPDSHDEGHQHHGHGDLLGLLHDCEAVICHGMGWRAAQDLKANGITPYMIGEAMTSEEAVLGCAAGTLQTTGGFCRCHE